MKARVLREHHSEPRDWSRPWRDPPGLICCCTSTTQTLVVVGHQRTSISGTNYTLSVYDGSGAVQWRKDFGTTTAGNPSLPGRPVIDSSGNIYVPYGGKDGNIFNPELGVNQTAATYGMRKYDKAGTLQWDTSIAKGRYGIHNATCARMLSTGNIAMSHGFMLSGGKLQLFMTVLDTTGAIVTQFGYRDATWGWSAGAIAAIGTAMAFPFDVDGSDNYFMCFDASASISFNGIIKLNSSGVYQTHNISLTGSVDSVVYDLTHSKLQVCYYCANPHPYIGTERVHARMDPVALTFDYSNRIQDIWGLGVFDLTNSTIGAVNGYLVTGFDSIFKFIDMDQTTFHVRIPCGEARSTGPAVIAHYLDGLQDGSLYNYIVMTTTIAKGFGLSTCVDQTTSDVYSVQGLTPVAPNNFHVFKYATGGVSETWKLDTDIAQAYTVSAHTFTV